MSYPVRGYYHPEDCFATISEWESIAKQFVELEKQGFDIRSGIIDNNVKLVELINRWFKYQLYVETQHYDDLTQKHVLDFIEDFVNHRVWTLRNDYQEFFPKVDEIKIAFFYSRGTLEPYVLLNKNFTTQFYGESTIILNAYHYTSLQGIKNIYDAVINGSRYAISTFTVQHKTFFRPESNWLAKVKGELVAVFKSDVKSITTDLGNKAANMLRLGYPGEESNIETDLDMCNFKNDTGLWNEVIMKPIEILDRKKIYKY